MFTNFDNNNTSHIDIHNPNCSTCVPLNNNFLITEIEKINIDNEISKEKSICIVPEILKILDKRIYNPSIFFIGMYNFNEVSFNIKYKIFSLKYIYNIVNQTNEVNQQKLDNIINIIVNNEENIINFYYNLNNSSNYSKNKISLDACFIALFIYEYRAVNHKNNKLFSDPYIHFQRIYILKDFLLMENQIPLLTIINVLRILVTNERSIMRNYSFNSGSIDNSINMLISNIINIMYPFQEISRVFKKHGDSFDKIKNNTRIEDSIHLLDHMYKFMTYNDNTDESDLRFYERSSTLPASKLIKAGITFKYYYGNVTQIKFDDNKKILELPKITIYNTTEHIFKNLMIYEASIKRKRYILQYTFLMDVLIDSIEDLNILIDSEIIVNRLGDPIKIVELWNNINTNFNVCINKNFKEEIFDKINNTYKNSFNRMFTEFKQNYFSKPWLIISLIVGSLIALSTIANAITSGLALKK